MDNKILTSVAYQKAEEKLNKEFENFEERGKAEAVKTAVFAALKQFALQEPEFAEAITQSDKTFGDCCKHVVADAGNVLSDIEAYTRAVKFYFSGAEISFSMRIETNPQDEPETQPQKKKSSVLNMSLDDLFDI